VRQLVLLTIVFSLTSCSRDDGRVAIVTFKKPPMTFTDPHTAFWQWFQDNIDRFNRFENDRECLMGELSGQLHQIDENLTYEVSNDKFGIRELVVSADGIKESFTSVLELTKQAPDIPGWKITAFRPRVNVSQFTLCFDGRDLAAKDFYFWLQSEGHHIDLILYVPGLTEDNRNEFLNACYILLDMAIGEYDVTTRIRYIDHKLLPTNPTAEGLKPLTELPKEFDELYGRLHPSGT